MFDIAPARAFVAHQNRIAAATTGEAGEAHTFPTPGNVMRPTAISTQTTRNAAIPRTMPKA